MQNTANQINLVQSPFMTLGQETRRAYSTMLSSLQGAAKTTEIYQIATHEPTMYRPSQCAKTHFSDAVESQDHRAY